MWTVQIPDDSVEVNLNTGEAILEMQNVCSVFDAFTVPNSLNPVHPLGLVTAVVRSLRIRWNGMNRRRSFNNRSTFRGDFIEDSATIDLTVATPSTMPPFTPAAQDGFQFVADPRTTITDFAQIGHEDNGALF
jgi:hypothetical protein